MKGKRGTIPAIKAEKRPRTQKKRVEELEKHA